MLLIGQIVGSYDLDRVLASGETIRSHSLYLPALVLILLGALTKSAQFPFHFWLPNAMAAPTPVSAFLHSATMVKAGVFLLARLWPVHGRDTTNGSGSLGLAGMASLLFGAYLRDLPAGPKGLARLFDDQPSRADHHCCSASAARWAPSPPSST